MDVPLMIAGALLVVWPLQHRRSMRRIRGRIAARGGDTGRFERAMNRQWIHVALVAAPVTGSLFIIVGATG
jgi:hypothetical protein